MSATATPAAHELAPVRLFGIDFSSQRCVVAESSGDVVLNELGAMTTATLVSFKGDERLIGEAAVLASSTNPRNTIDHLNLLVGQSLSHVQMRVARSPGQRVNFTATDNGEVVANVEYGKEKTAQFTVEQVTAMLFGKLAQQIKTRLHTHEHEHMHAVVAIPSSWTEKERRTMILATKIAGIPHSSVITRDAALARCYHRKHPLHAPQDESAAPVVKHIVILDMGHTTTSAAVVKLTPEGETVLSTECDLFLGAECFDRHLFDHFQQEIKEKHNVNVDFHSKEGKRLFQACDKLKKLLSTIGEANVIVENVAQDRDIPIKTTREVFEQLCASESEKVTQMLQSVLSKAQIASEEIASVEIVGGGTRIPFVQTAILNAFPSEKHTNLIGRMLDSTTSIAVGAAFSGEPQQQEEASDMEVDVSDANQQLVEQWAALEVEMQRRDAELAAIANEKNAIEAFVYEMRAKRDGKHGEKLDTQVLNPILDAAEDWIYSEEADRATLENLQIKRQEIEQNVRTICQAYFEAVAQDDQALEAHLEEEAKKAEAERMAEGGDDDHDTRKLKKPERMRLVVKNKEEGNALFRDGNYQHAAMRYVKALSHSAKFFDLSPSDKEEVDALKLSLYLNLAQCYLKMENWSKAIANCKEALVIDPKNVKALYRRAVAYDKDKNLELAVQDVKEALKLAPTDKAIMKLDERLKILVKRQVDKEKKMWSKAFA